MIDASLHARAPQSAAFIESMRAVFGDVKAIRVREGDVILGKPDTCVYATCTLQANGRPLAEWLKEAA